MPSWINTLSTGSIAADMAAAISGGTVTYDGLLKLLQNLNATLSSSNQALTAAHFADLKTIAANLNNEVAASDYLVSIMNSLVNGSAANATWTGGSASSTALGNLAAGASATKLDKLIGKWFLGADLPSSSVSMPPYSFSVSYSNVTSPVFGAGGPGMNDINQGFLGDCYLLASLAEVAYKNPGVISSMFTANGNNTYGVRYYIDGAAQYVTVNTALAGGGNDFNYGANIWGSLAEKAYAQLQTGGNVTGNPQYSGNTWSAIGNGGYAEYALAQITGTDTITDYCANGGSWAVCTYNSSLDLTGYSAGWSTAAIQINLVNDLAEGDNLILSSWTNAKDSRGYTTLVAGHAFSIYGFNNATGMFQIRNPWGTGAGQYWNTTFEVSLSTLLAAGDTITVDNIGGSSPPSPNLAPTVTSQTATQTWKLWQTVNFTLAPNTFTDPDGDALTYKATLANGQALPSWLSFNAATKTFTGFVPNTVNGLSIKVTATDTGGLSASETFQVLTPGSAPVLTLQTATQTWKRGLTVNFKLASNTFTDPDRQTLTYTATLANGQALPSWLSFNKTTATFAGVVPNTANGLSIKVTATDTSGLSASETFQVLTPASAPVLTLQTPAQTWKLGQKVSFKLAANTFTDPDGQRLTYKATLANGQALPSWLSFNKTTGTFTGVVPNTVNGLSIKVTATDTSGLSASETFQVLTPGSAPVLNLQTAAQTWKLGQRVNFKLASNTFTDPDRQKLTYTATLANGQALPSWLSFNRTTATFTGVVPNTVSGLNIKVTATDTSGLSASETFSVLTPGSAPVLSAPVLTVQTAAQTWMPGQRVNFRLASNTFTDPQRQKLTYTAKLASGSALPSWLSFNKATATFTGLAPKTASGLSIMVNATNTRGLSASETFNVTVGASRLSQAIAQLNPASQASAIVNLIKPMQGDQHNLFGPRA